MEGRRASYFIDLNLSRSRSLLVDSGSGNGFEQRVAHDLRLEIEAALASRPGPD